MRRVEMLRKLADQGYTNGEIAEKMGLKKSTVRQYAWQEQIGIKRDGVKMDARLKRQAAKRQEIVDYVKANPSAVRLHVAAMFGVSTVTVRKALEDAGLPTTRQYDVNGQLLVDGFP